MFNRTKSFQSFLDFLDYLESHEDNPGELRLYRSDGEIYQLKVDELKSERILRLVKKEDEEKD